MRELQPEPELVVGPLLAPATARPHRSETNRTPLIAAGVVAALGLGVAGALFLRSGPPAATAPTTAATAHVQIAPASAAPPVQPVSTPAVATPPANALTEAPPARVARAANSARRLSAAELSATLPLDAQGGSAPPPAPVVIPSPEPVAIPPAEAAPAEAAPPPPPARPKVVIPSDPNAPIALHPDGTAPN